MLGDIIENMVKEKEQDRRVECRKGRIDEALHTGLEGVGRYDVAQLKSATTDGT
jgi:hypothetical protein